MAEAMDNTRHEAPRHGRLFGSSSVVIDGVEYARADFEKVPASTPHQDRCREAHHALRQVFRTRPMVAFVAAELNVYYDQQRPRLAVAPDVMVAVGAQQRDRIRYRVWEEPVPPSFVLEVLSSSTRNMDIGDGKEQKKAIYAFMGVSEYFVLDGDGGLMAPPRLRGFRLVESARGVRGYEPMASWSAVECRQRGAVLGYWSETLDLGVALRSGVKGVRFFDPTKSDFLATDDEDAARRSQERMRAEYEQARANRERARADCEQARADQERELRLQAQARLAELERLRDGH